MLLFVLFATLLVSSHGATVSQRAEPLKELFGITFPPIKIPDIVNPDVIIPPNVSEIPATIAVKERGLFPLPTIKIPDIKILPTALPKIPDIVKNLPTLPHILPTALPKLPTIKIPTIPNILPTALPKIPTIKIPTLPHILPTALPTIFPKPEKKQRDTPYTLPYPLPSDIAPIPFLGGNIICDICESVVSTVKSRFIGLEKAVKVKLTDLVSNVCNLLAKFDSLPVLSMSCNLMKTNFIGHLFDKLDAFENTVTPKGVCKVLPMCRK